MSLTEYRVGDKAIWNQGRIYERERIIKLLEELDCLDYKTCRYPSNECIWCGNHKPEVIALIKGENNE